MPRHTTSLVVWLALAALAPARGSDDRTTDRTDLPPVIDDDAQTTYRQVTWDDFRGRRITFRGGQAARIATTVEIEPIEIEVEDSAAGFVARPGSVRVYALMSKLESGYDRGGRSDWSLAHEQGHFDITEFTARKLRAELRGVRATGATREEAVRELQEELGRVQQRTHEEWTLTQQRYDGETGHGTVKKAQKRWWQTIEQWLAQPPP